MGEVTEQAEGASFAPDDDDGPLFPEGAQGEESGTVTSEPVADEPGQGLQEPASEPQEGAEPAGQAEGQEAEQPADAGSELAGKRVVLAGPSEAGPFTVVTNAHLEGSEAPGDVTPVLFEGDDREARLDALERVKSLGEKAAEEPGKVFLVTVPAASWKPRAPKPRPRKTDWSV